MNTIKSPQLEKDIGTAYLFGSQATGKNGPLSDYDIAILFDETVPEKDYFDKKLELIGKFSQFYKTNKIDLVILNTAPNLLAMNVISEGKILFEKDKDYRIAFETHVMSCYYDRLPYEIRYSEALLNRLSA